MIFLHSHHHWVICFVRETTCILHLWRSATPEAITAPMCEKYPPSCPFLVGQFDTDRRSLDFMGWRLYWSCSVTHIAVNSIETYYPSPNCSCIDFFVSGDFYDALNVNRSNISHVKKINSTYYHVNHYTFYNQKKKKRKKEKKDGLWAKRFILFFHITNIQF